MKLQKKFMIPRNRLESQYIFGSIEERKYFSVEKNVGMYMIYFRTVMTFPLGLQNLFFI